jgi:hypothetical protein
LSDFSYAANHKDLCSINKYSFIFSIKIIKMKNKILSGFAALSIAAIAVFNLGLVSKSSDLSDVSLANVEALAEETDTAVKYNKVKSDCEKEFTTDFQGYATVLKQRVKIGGANVQVKVKYTKVNIDCPLGTDYLTCKECSCANFWDKKCD